MLSIGDKIPSFNLPLDGGDYFNSFNNEGKNVILYFYHSLSLTLTLSLTHTLTHVRNCAAVVS